MALKTYFLELKRFTTTKQVSPPSKDMTPVERDRGWTARTVDWEFDYIEELVAIFGDTDKEMDSAQRRMCSRVLNQIDPWLDESRALHTGDYLELGETEYEFLKNRLEPGGKDETGQESKSSWFERRRGFTHPVLYQFVDDCKKAPTRDPRKDGAAAPADDDEGDEPEPVAASAPKAPARARSRR